MNLSYLKCYLVALGGTSLPIAAKFFSTGKQNKVFINFVKEEKENASFANEVFSIMPAALANFIDVYLHPYVSNDKYVKYGLTALESSFFSLFFIKTLPKQQEVVNAFPQFKNVLTSISNVSLFSQALVIGAALQAVTYKYLFNDSEKTPVELDLDSSSEAIL